MLLFVCTYNHFHLLAQRGLCEKSACHSDCHMVHTRLLHHTHVRNTTHITITLHATLQCPTHTYIQFEAMVNTLIEFSVSSPVSLASRALTSRSLSVFYFYYIPGGTTTVYIRDQEDDIVRDIRREQ